MKSTHSGECQLCGRVQKLPGGKLAKHGYTVRWNFFSGTCPGSGYAPYELSCDLLAAQILLQTERAKNLAREAQQVREERDHVWVHEYVPATWEVRRSSHAWRKLPRSEVEFKDYRYYYVDKKGRREAHTPYRTDGSVAKTPDEIVAALNDARARAYEQEVQKIEGYITWLRQRAKAWKLRALTPVAA